MWPRDTIGLPTDTPAPPSSEISHLNSPPPPPLNPPRHHPLSPNPRPPKLDPQLSSPLMASQKQLAANRLNAKKSTGPRSPQGKARSSMNALKTGIDAGTHIIQHESPSRLEALADEYYDRFHPTTPEQRMLVDTLVDSEWLLRRFRRVEAQLWQQGFPDRKSTRLN